MNDKRTIIRASIGQDVIIKSVGSMLQIKEENGIVVDAADGEEVTLSFAKTGLVTIFSYDEEGVLHVSGPGLTSVTQIGYIKGISFEGSPNLRSVPLNLPYTIRILDNAFKDCTSFEGIYIPRWSMSNIESMDNMFNGATRFKQNLSNWSTHRVAEPTDLLVGTAMENNINMHPFFGSDIVDHSELSYASEDSEMDVKQIIVDNLQHAIGVGARYYLRKMISRTATPNAKVKTHQYRIFKGRTPVTTLDELVGHLDNESLRIDVSHKDASGINTIPINVAVENLTVYLNPEEPTDQPFIQMFGYGKMTISFMLSYLTADTDTLPYKIVKITLGSKNKLSKFEDDGSNP